MKNQFYLNFIRYVCEKFDSNMKPSIYCYNHYYYFFLLALLEATLWQQQQFSFSGVKQKLYAFYSSHSNIRRFERVCSQQFFSLFSLPSYEKWNFAWKINFYRERDTSTGHILMWSTTVTYNIHWVRLASMQKVLHEQMKKKHKPNKNTTT